MDDPKSTREDDLVDPPPSPVSGVSVALGAGETVSQEGFSPADARRAMRELPAYLLVQMSWFTAFGMQMVLFPYLLKNRLDVSGSLLGMAQMALSLPAVVFILLGGVVAERASGRALMVGFHLLAILPALALAMAVRSAGLVYWQMLIYALAMGTIGAFMLPARDAILNDVVDRRRRCGSGITLQQGVGFATLAQFAAQIAGLALGGGASAVGAWPLLVVQGIIVGAGAAAAIFLAPGPMVSTGGKSAPGVFADIAEGVRAVAASPVLLSMVVSMFGVGVFVIGAFLVVLPIVNADVYGRDSTGLRNIFVTFWAGAFVSSAALTRVRRLERPGRALLIAQFLGSSAILTLTTEAPYWAFLTLVLVWGLAAGVSIMLSRGIVQQEAPPRVLARVLSIYQLGFMAGAPLGAGLLGVLTDSFGARLVILVPSLGMLCVVAMTALLTPIWRLGDPSPR
jgi:MFS family permease